MILGSGITELSGALEHMLYSLCVCVCVCARVPQAEEGVHRPGRYGGHPSQVCEHAGSVCVCVCLMHTLVWV